MRTSKLILLKCVAAAAGTVALSSGCQTYDAGLTMATPHYLKHYPNYFPEDPKFPLQRERDSMLDPTGEIRKGALPGTPPAGLPQAPVGVADPVPLR